MSDRRTADGETTRPGERRRDDDPAREPEQPRDEALEQAKSLALPVFDDLLAAEPPPQLSAAELAWLQPLPEGGREN
jgi:hypothetical protein